jgi:thiol-disulfide isomerase/thioredoxin
MAEQSAPPVTQNPRRKISFGTRVRILLFLVVCLMSLGANAQSEDLVTLERFQQIVQAEKDQIQVVNFWATWCAPCIKELPLLERLTKDNKDVKVRLVSMDMDLDPNPDKVRKFATRKNIQSQVLILNEKDPNLWIDKIDKRWSGALPATLVINNRNGKRKFIERELHEGDLEKLIAEVK